MNFNSDLSKIPSYPIPGLTELVDELPHGGHHPLAHHDGRHESQRILNTPDAALMSQIVNAISNTPTELMNTQPGSIDGINNSPFYQVLNRSNEMFNQRNLQQSGMLPSHLGVYPQHNVLPGSSIQSNYPPSIDTSTSRINPVYPVGGGSNRPAVSRPVQAVAPQPRHPRQHEKPGNFEVETPPIIESDVKSKLEVNSPHLQQTISTPPTDTAEENKKICLKIRRTKKSHKNGKDRHSGSEQPEYGIVSDNNSENNNGPIKLKISRLKPSTSGDQTSSIPSEDAFQVSSMTTGGYTPKSESQAPPDDTEQRKAEDAASAMVREIFKNRTPSSTAVSQYGGFSQMNQTPVAKPLKTKSKSERKSHKHRSHSSSGSKSETKRPQVQSPAVQQHVAHTSYPFSVNQSPLPSNQQYHPNVAKHNSMPVSHKHQQHADLSVPAYPNSLQSSQSHMFSNPVDSFAPPPNLQQQHYQQANLPQMNDSSRNTSYPSQHKAPISGVNYPAPVHHSDVNNPNFMQKKSWDPNVHQSHQYQMASTHKPALPVTEPKPPPYNEALMQQNQFYSNIFQHSGSLIDNNLMMQQQEHNLMQQKLKKAEELKMISLQQPQYSSNYQPLQQQQQQQTYYPPSDTQQLVYPSLTSPPAQITHDQLNAHRPLQNTPSHNTSRLRDSGHTISYMNTPENKSSSGYHRSSSKSKKKATSSDSQSNLALTDIQNKLKCHGFVQLTGKIKCVTKHVNKTVPDTKSTTSDSQGTKNVTMKSNIQEGWKHALVVSGGSDHVRVKFIADSEEADIYKLKDILYQDDTEVTNFSELEPGTPVVAKWPMNGKLYAAVVINPLDNSGRRFRERKPPPKPFQMEANTKRDRLPSVVMEKLSSQDLPPGVTVSDTFPHDLADRPGGFGAYLSMADRIKMKKREREGKIKQGKKRKWDDVDRTGDDLINIQSDEEFASPAPKRSNKEEKRRKERRRAMETRMLQEDGEGSVQRLQSKINSIFDNVDDLDPQSFVRNEDDTYVHPGLLISRMKLQDLNGETARLKSRGFLSQLPKKMLIRFLTILESNVRFGAKLKPIQPKGESPEEQKWNRESALDRVNNSTEASIVAMNILSAPFMPKAVYNDDVMEMCAVLLKYQLKYTIYPEYDVVYKTPTQKKKKGGKEVFGNASVRMKRAHFKGSKNKSIVQLYNKLNVLLNQWVELVLLQPLTDTTVLMMSTIGVTPFFVENINEIQLSAIKLTSALFSKYEKHRTLILDDILQSLSRLPSSKRNLRSYRLTHAEETVDSSDEEEDAKKRLGAKSNDLQFIQMITALILQMLHSVVHLALPGSTLPIEEDMSVEERKKQMKIEKDINETKVITSYDAIERTAHHFISVFLKKCSTKSDETDFRPLFENFVHDLLSTVNKPEWPAAEMLLSILGRLLVRSFTTKSIDMSLRVASLDYLGVVAAKLRRDAVSSHDEVATIKALLQRLEDAFAEEEGDVVKEQGPDDAAEVKEGTQPLVESDDAILTRKLQYLLLGYLRKNAVNDSSLLYAHNFYIGQWLRDCSVEFQQLEQDPSRKTDAGEELDNLSLKLQLCQKKKDALLEIASSAASASAKISGDLSPEELKTLKISSEQKHAEKLASGLTVEDATLVSRHLASSLPFSRSFDRYLFYIIHMTDDLAVALRTRSIKCLAEVVSVDPSIMEREDISDGVRRSLTDSSTSVREAAIDLVGRFILLRPNLVKHYYSMLIKRILDTGVSVRKRVIRILQDLFNEHPDLPQLTDACVKMIRRVNDEDGIKKLVHEVFMKMWFSPVDPNDTEKLRKKALLISDIVSANRDHGYEWIEQLFKNLIDTPEKNANVEKACQQIVDCLVQHVIIFENPDHPNKDMNVQKATEENNNQPPVKREMKKGHTVRMVATIQTLVQLAKIRPRLLVPHMVTLQPYLASKCENNDDFLVCNGVCRTLELAVPLMEHPSEIFLKSVEEDVMRLILTQPIHYTPAAISCLAAITCKVTNNYQLIWDCFNELCGTLAAARNCHRKNPVLIFQPASHKQLLRAVFIAGNFCKNFDFDDDNFKGKKKITGSVKDKVYDVFFYFSTIRFNKVTEQLKTNAITALGSLMIKDPDMMFRPKTRELYKSMLEQNQKSVKLKKQVLLNLQSYLQIEDVQMQEAAEASAKKSKQNEDEVVRKKNVNAAEEEEDIKEICDVSSGMASSVMQLFLKQVSDAIFHHHVVVRHAALHTIFLTLQQGLVHPGQCVPYLIAAASDPTPAVHKEADQQLTDLNKRYSGFVQVSALHGLKLSFQLQSCMTRKGEIVRGYFEHSLSEDTATCRKASCAHLYQLIRPDRKFRRSFLLNLLNLFDDTVKTDLKLLLFIADNLAYFPYHTYDEPLFLMSQIDVYVSVSGSNVLQTFKESLQAKRSKQEKREEKRKKKSEWRMEVGGEDRGSSSSSSDSSSSDDGDVDISSRLPLHDESLEEFARLSLACLLLFWLKHHLKTLFGFTENKIRKYSTSEVNRANDKQIHRKVADLKFEPQLALEHLERARRGIHCRHPEYQAAVVKQYTEFNDLINKLDPNEDESDSDKEKKPTSHVKQAEITPTKMEEIEDSDRDTDNEVHKPAVPLDTIRRSTALKSKKRHRERKRVDKIPDLSHFNTDPPERRKRASVKYAESSSDSEADFRGF